MSTNNNHPPHPLHNINPIDQMLNEMVDIMDYYGCSETAAKIIMWSRRKDSPPNVKAFELKVVECDKMPSPTQFR